MVVPGLLPAMASLPALPRGLAPGQAQDVDLFPAFKGGGVHARMLGLLGTTVPLAGAVPGLCCLLAHPRWV